MSNPEDLRKIQLLEEYVQCLQRENFAKNSQTSIIYQQLQSLQQQNNMLKSFIQTTKTKWQEEKRELNERLQQREEIQFVNNRNFGDQLRNSVDISSMKAVAEDMRLELQAREKQVNQLTQQKYQLQSQVQYLKEQLADSTCRAMKCEQKLRNQMQHVKQLQNQIYGLKNSRCQTKSGVSFAKLQVDKLVKQNNELIEKIRYLQKQKNGYYNQLKMASPLKSRVSAKENRSAQKPGQGKSERWSVMQQKLRAIRNQNQQLKANLAIN